MAEIGSPPRGRTLAGLDAAVFLTLAAVPALAVVAILVVLLERLERR